ncbi:adenosine-specific kinase [Acaryochloris sp. CCMEE 5410]|uniref:adenosine-specific kinase n=1 Tax=Acaryochloris sp. CCMEE 5410 TaxID=310037 RepID=UPI000248461E|nr:adenosine-specific kinase [Acaryochloris sp. CCMEE 5410]KAI9129689.1 adenosine-specific kinase [Acaryochloris sp. CCMEE 5410]
MEVTTVVLDVPEHTNLILGQSHFIKTVEDLYEIMVGTCPQAKFGLAFCEASGPCLIRFAGNDPSLQDIAVSNAKKIAAGHSFILLMQDAFPISVLNAIQQSPEVCTIYCATANPVEVILAKTDQGAGVLGVIDGFAPKGVEGEEDILERQDFLRQIGYKF